MKLLNIVYGKETIDKKREIENINKGLGRIEEEIEMRNPKESIIVTGTMRLQGPTGDMKEEKLLIPNSKVL